jgi:hypothetical protein
VSLALLPTTPDPGLLLSPFLPLLASEAPGQFRLTELQAGPLTGWKSPMGRMEAPLLHRARPRGVR